MEEYSNDIKQKTKHNIMMDENIKSVDGCSVFKCRFRSIEIKAASQSVVLNIGFKKYDLSKDFDRILKREGLKFENIPIRIYQELVQCKTVAIGSVNINLQKTPSGYIIKDSAIKKQSSINENVNEM